MAKKKENKIVLMRGEAEFHYIALVIMILLMIFCIIPLILMLTVSLSSEASLVRGYRFIPDEWSLDAYAFMWAKRTTIFRAYGLTIMSPLADKARIVWYAHLLLFATNHERGLTVVAVRGYQQVQVAVVLIGRQLQSLSLTGQAVSRIFLAKAEGDIAHGDTLVGQ